MKCRRSKECEAYSERDYACNYDPEECRLWDVNKICWEQLNADRGNEFGVESRNENNG